MTESDSMLLSIVHGYIEGERDEREWASKYSSLVTQVVFFQAMVDVAPT